MTTLCQNLATQKSLFGFRLAHDLMCKKYNWYLIPVCAYCMVLTVTDHVNDIFPCRVYASPSWIFIYSYNHQGHNDTGLSNSIKSLVV